MGSPSNQTPSTFVPGSSLTTQPKPAVTVPPPSTNNALPAPALPTVDRYPPVKPGDTPVLQRPTIEGVPPVNGGPRLNSTPAVKPETQDRMTSRPVYQATYFQLIPSPPNPTPVRNAATVEAVPAAAAPAIVNPAVDDGGWRPSHD
jgi:hypothetical protein